MMLPQDQTASAEARRVDDVDACLGLIPEDAGRLAAVAFHLGRTPSEIIRTLLLTELDRYSYDVCRRCGNGRPVCAPLPNYGPFLGMSREQVHEALCATYIWDDDVCAQCQVAMREEQDGEVA